MWPVIVLPFIIGRDKTSTSSTSICLLPTQRKLRQVIMISEMKKFQICIGISISSLLLFEAVEKASKITQPRSKKGIGRYFV
jgi:hypothetical protein